ncbi:MAG: DUF2461 domain-containing protein [Thermomicrobiales bacterium]|nr:DUF2461 domain-containing protein [Thermomicrobiales bacterium]
MSDFQGFSPAFFTFYEDLARDNSREFWQANKQRWEQDVHLPMQTLLDILADEFGPMRMFRPNRDLRFSKDKSPYRLSAAAISTSHSSDNMGYYIELSAAGLIVGYGAMMISGDRLARFRDALVDIESGTRFAAICAELAQRDLPVTSGAEPSLRRDPAGYATSGPGAEYLRWKGAVVVKEYDRADWMYSPELLQTIRTVWRSIEPLRVWLESCVR